jgi:hypothetical protein
MSHDVFISYSSKNKVLADQVCDKLESSNIRCWMAPRDITAGTDWTSSIVDSIKSCRVLILIFTDDVNASSQIPREICLAINHNVVVLPLRVTSTNPAGNLEYLLSTIHWFDAFNPPLEQCFDKLIDLVGAIVARVSAQSGERTPVFAPESGGMAAPDLKEKLLVAGFALREHVAFEGWVFDLVAERRNGMYHRVLVFSRARSSGAMAESLRALAAISAHYAGSHWLRDVARNWLWKVSGISVQSAGIAVVDKVDGHASAAVMDSRPFSTKLAGMTGDTLGVPGIYEVETGEMLMTRRLAHWPNTVAYPLFRRAVLDSLSKQAR